MPSSLLIAVTHKSVGAEVLVAIWNIAGRGNPVCSLSGGPVSTGLWVIPKARRNKEEVVRRLQEVPAICNVSAAALSDPIRKNELVQVRDVFAQVYWDSSQVTDGSLALFLNAKLKGQYSYYIDFNLRDRPPRKIQIKRIEDQPGFSPDWLKSSPRIEQDDPDKEYTVDDFKISTVDLDSIKHKAPRTPRPPKNKKENDK